MPAGVVDDRHQNAEPDAYRASKRPAIERATPPETEQYGLSLVLQKVGVIDHLEQHVQTPQYTHREYCERKIRAAKRAARSELSVSRGDWYGRA